MKYLLLSLVLFQSYSCNTEDNTVSQWRGDGRSGIYAGSDLLDRWPEEGPAELWHADSLGPGYASPVIAGDRLYITGEIDSMTVLHCFDLEGKHLWQQVYGREWMKSYPGSRNTPTVFGDRIYVGTGLGDLYCLDRKDGTIVWTRKFLEDFQGVYPLHGHNEAVAVDGDRVFWTPGGSEHNALALNRFTGELIWSNPGLRERSGYNMGNLVFLNGRTIYVTFSAYHLMGFDAETGELLWSHEQDNLPPELHQPGYGDTHPNSVIFDGESIYYAASDGNDGVRLDLSADGSEIEEVWRQPGFDCFMGGIVKIGDYIYGSGDTRKYLKSVNAATGALVDSLKIGLGAVIAADSMLYYYNQQGEMKLIRFSEGKMEEISSFRISRGSSEHFSHPVINKGVLYQRHGEVLMAFNITSHSL